MRVLRRAGRFVAEDEIIAELQTWLGVLLLRMGSRRFPPTILTSGNRVRVLTHAPRLGDFIDLAFDQIRQNAAGNAAVLQRQLEVLLALADSPGAPPARHPIIKQAAAIEALMERSIPWEPTANRCASG